MPVSPVPPDARTPDSSEPNPLTLLTLPELRRRTSAKWRTYPDDVLPLWVAEMDVPLAAPVAEALRTAVETGDTGYAMGEPYADALAAFAKERWDWRIDTARTAIVPDVMLGVVEMLKLITEPGDAVVVNCPVYPPFYQFVGNMGLHVVEAPLGPDLRLDPGALERAFRVHRPRAYLLCNPHNPTGTVHTAAELAEAARLAEAHGVRVVADEIHAPLVLPGTGARFVPYLTVPGAERAFALLSASKAWNLAGAKAALAVAGPDAAAELARMPEEVSHGPSHLGALAHTAALRYGIPWLDALLAGLAANRTLLAGLLAEQLPDVRWRQPEGTFLTWLDCRALGLGDDPAAVFLDRGRVALSHGPYFGTGGAGHARLNLATTPEVLAEGVRRMAAAITPAAARGR